MRKIWIVLACVLVLALISVPMVLLAENIRYSKTYFSNELFSFVKNSKEEVCEVTIFNAKTQESTIIQDADLIAKLVEVFDGLIFREERKTGETDGALNTATIKTTLGNEISFSYASYGIRMEGKRYLCNTDELSNILDELFSFL